MKNPFRILGVSQNASEQELQDAYRTLITKHAGDPDRLQEIDDAYDDAIRILRGQPLYTSTIEEAAQAGEREFNPGESKFPDVRAMISAGRFSDAEELLDGVPEAGRGAEWFFLKGTILYNRGYLEEASRHFEEAARREPANNEYANAFKMVSEENSRNFYGNPYASSPCCGGDLCTTLMCLNCLCRAGRC